MLSRVTLATALCAAADAGNVRGRRLQGLDPFDSQGFIALRLPVGTAASGSSSNRVVTTQALAIDDFSGCLPSTDSSFSATCSPMREIAVPSTGDFPCTLGTNPEAGRVSMSADGLIATFYCMRQYPGTTLPDTGYDTSAFFGGAGIVATVDYRGFVNTSYVVGTNRVGPGNELDGGMIPTTAAAEVEGRYWLTGNRYDSAIGWWYLPTAPQDGIDTRLRGNDGYKGNLFSIWSTTSIKILNNNYYKAFAVPSSIFDPNIFTMASGNQAIDLDVLSNNTFFFVGPQGLSRAVRSATAGTWSYTTTTTITSLRFVAVSRDKQYVYAATETRAYVYNAATMAILNNGQPLVTLVGTNQFRGISCPPLPPPEPTPTQTATPSPTATASSGSSPSTTETGTPTGTPTVSPSPSIRGHPVPVGAFAVVRMGAVQGQTQFTLPNPAADIALPAQVEIYHDCGVGCTAPVLDRLVKLPYADYRGDHAEDRALTLNSGSSGVIPLTYRQGRLVPSESRHVLTLGGYATPAGWNFNTAPQKVEPITFALTNTGWFNISTGCKIWSPGYRAIYCNGFDADEIPQAIATTDGKEFWIAGGEDPASTPYGISYYNDALLAPVNIIGGSNFYQRIQIFGGRFYFVNLARSDGTGAMHRIDGIPRSATLVPNPLFTSPTIDWRDFDVFSHSQIVVGGINGLEMWTQAVDGAWATVANTDKTNIIGTGISVDRSTVYVSTASSAGSAVFAYTVATGTYTNGGAALLTAGPNTQFRGVAAAPIPPSNTPTQTPSTSSTPSNTPSVTSSVSMTGSNLPPDASRSNTETPTVSGTATPTVSGSSSVTASNSPTPTQTMTGRGGPIPANSFVVVVIGDGNSAVPRFDADITSPASFSVYEDCGSGCTAPLLRRSQPIFGNLLGSDRYGNRAWTLNAGNVNCLTDIVGRCRSTFRHGRLVPSGDRGTLLSGGFDVGQSYNLASAKREPSLLRITGNGWYNVTTPCKVIRSPVNVATNDFFYCNGFDANELPLAMASDDGETNFWLTGGEEPASTYGVRHFTGNWGTAPASIGVGDRNDYERVQVYNGRLWMMTRAGGTSGTSAMYRFGGLPIQAVAKPGELFRAASTATVWNDFALTDAADGTTVVWVAATNGLLRYAVNPATSAYEQRLLGGPADLITVGVSNDGTTVYAVCANNTFSGLFSFDVGTLTFNNNGAPILLPAPFTQFRGVAAAPIVLPSKSNSPSRSATPSNTASTSLTASQTPSISVTATESSTATASATASLTVGALPSGTASPSGTATATSSPSSSMTPRGGRALPGNGFIVAVLGNGSSPLPNTVAEILLPVTLNVYGSCASGCSAPTLDRSIALPSRAFGDAYGNRAATLTSGSTGGRATFLQGRLIPSEDRSKVTMGLYDVYAGYRFGSKREPIAFSMDNNGFWSTFMPCMTLRTTSSGLIDDPYYCNGFNHAEPPYAVAADADGYFYISAADVPGSTYGIKVWNSTLAVVGPRNMGLQDRNDYYRVQVFSGSLYFMSATAAAGNGAMYRIARKPRIDATAARPAPMFTGITDDWQDFDIRSHDEIFVGARSGLIRFRFNGTAWVRTTWTAVTEIVGVAVSNDGFNVYVSTASPTSSAVYVFDVDTEAFTNNNAPVLSAPAGFQFRGVAAAPVPATVTPVPTTSVTSSATPSSSASETASITASASPTQSSGETPTGTNTETPSVTGTASSSQTATPTRTETSTGTGTRTGTPTRSISASGIPPSATASVSATATPSRTGTAAATASRTETGTNTGSRTGTPSSSESETPSASATQSGTPSSSETETGTPSASATETGTPSASSTETGTGSSSASVTAASTGSSTATASVTQTGTGSKSRAPALPSRSRTATRTKTKSRTKSRTRSRTPSRKKKVLLE